VTDSVVFSVERGVESFADRDLGAARDAAGTTWVRAHDADAETLAGVAEAFGIHPLAVEDVRNNVRPKTEEFTDYTFVLVKAAELTKGDSTFDEEVRDDPVGVFVGDDWVVTLSTAAVPGVDRVWRAVERGDERLL
jgi:magnesium transporter